MNNFVKTAIAAAIAMSLPLAAVAPATALTVTEAGALENTFDCATMAERGVTVGLWDDGATVTLVNCVGAYLGDADDTRFASTEDGFVDDQGLLEIDETPEVLTFTGETWVDVLGEPANGAFAAIVSRPVFDLGNPSGELLAESSATISLEADEFVIGNSDQIDAEEEIAIDGDLDCGVQAGSHVYTVQRITVDVAGEYTFRVVGTDPVSSFMRIGEYTPMEDPMIALYEGDFDPADPNSAVAGCNDDLNDITIDGFDWSSVNDEENVDRVYARTEADKAIEGHFPVFTAELEPGDYSMLVTTFWPLSAEDWAAGEDADEEWTAGSANIEYEVWGPESGAELVDEFALASTGVDPSFGLWSGLALAGTGVAITVARRRSQRA